MSAPTTITRDRAADVLERLAGEVLQLGKDVLNLNEAARLARESAGYAQTLAKDIAGRLDELTLQLGELSVDVKGEEDEQG